MKFRESPSTYYFELLPEWGMGEGVLINKRVGNRYISKYKHRFGEIYRIETRTWDIEEIKKLPHYFKKITYQEAQKICPGFE